MGLALGAALRRSGVLDRLLYIGRSLEPPPHPIFEVAGEDDVVRAEYRMGPIPIPSGTTVFILSVPDSTLAEVAHDFAAAGSAPGGCAALHMAGAISNDVLTPLHHVGFATGSMHPLQAVADPWQSGERLIGSAFSLSGEPAALTAARRLVNALDGMALVIPQALRPLYHAAAVTASNYLVALAAVAARMLVEAGVSEVDALPALLPLMKGTLDNLEHLGPLGALTGPISRGDVDTVRLHLARLSAGDRVLYCDLGAEVLRLARAAGLDERRAEHIESLLSHG
jgi:predicted short-subunit dehydrogenase-like oxidoreductase (DUF2520 family)